MKVPKSILIGAFLMILLGLGRGYGGIALIKGGNTFATIETSNVTIRILGTILILIGILEIISAIGILRLKRRFWISGVIVTIAFVIDGVINGYFLFGSPGLLGAIVNSAVAAVIIFCLFIGRSPFGFSDEQKKVKAKAG